jgi:nucleoid-associated protein YgaU/chemotaxis signal transduction protein
MPTADIDTLLIFRIASIACAVPAQEVDSIVMPPQHLTHPPGSSQSAPGIFQYHNQVHAVIDLHQRFGIDIPRQGQGRLLLHHDDSGHYALWVDEVLGLVRSEQGKWAPLPPYLPRALFWSGFLYQKEIVLCSRLESLRRMHDASPLHLHLAELRKAQQARGEEEPKSGPPESARNKPLAAAPHGTLESEPPPRPVAAEEAKPAAAATERPAPAYHAPSARPVPPPSGHAARAVPPPTPSRRPEASPPAAATVGKMPKQPPISRPPLSPTSETASPTPAPATERPPIPSTEPASSLLPWLLLLFIAFAGGGVYWLWGGSEPVPPPRPEQARLPREPAAAAPIEMPSVRSQAPAPGVKAPAAEHETPPLAAKEAPSPVSKHPAPTTATLPLEGEPSAAGEAITTEPQSPVVPPGETALTPGSKMPGGKPAEPPTAPPLRIERGGDDTLNLIIDRAAAGKAEQEAPAPLSEQAAKEAPAKTGTEAPPKEEPLQPEADWPKPLPPEPCECLHIVVKGDTLWDIAERYTHNAFNYPELARRSGIRNPDLIYPGDKVRIIVR